MPVQTPPHEPVNILLVDDQPGKLLSYEAILGELGENLLTATSGREALRKLLTYDIPVVLMDVSMPELDGFALAEIIRQHPRFEETAIIFVSAVHLSDVDRMKAYETGAVDYVSVPIVPEILRAKVRIFTELHRRTRDAERLNAELESRVAERTAELEEAARKETAMADRLREADRRKDEFLALLAHELRNPLAPMTSAVHLMNARPIEDPQLAWCRGVFERQLQQLTRLVDDLLDVSRLTLGKIRLRREALDLRHVVTAAVEAARPGLEKQRHVLSVTLPSDPVMVDGDEARLVQVVANLLNNAIKYQREQGTVAVRLICERHEAIVTVRDDGIGVPAELQARLFGLFVQGDQMPERAASGLGVGLSLVKALVELHGGRVGVESPGIGQGSTFWIRVPVLEQAEVGADSVQALQSSPGPGSRWRTLVLDDNVDAAEGLALLLEISGHEVFRAHDAAGAMEIVRRDRPDVLLVDLGLPGTDGYEFCRQVRAQGCNGVILAVTGYGQAQDRARSAAAGFDGHLVKPLDFEQLLRAVEEVRQERRHRCVPPDGSPAAARGGTGTSLAEDPTLMMNGDTREQ